jgi:alanine racemase
VPNSPRRRVEFSTDALRSNLVELIEQHHNNLVVDLRCNAYGYGSTWVREAAEQLGCSQFITDDSPYDPIPETTTDLVGLSSGLPVATVIGEVVALKTIPIGESVSYGYTWTATRESRLALVSLGFADGIPRAGSNTGFARIGGQPVPVIGRIAMDQLVLDVTDIDVAIGDDVNLWTSHGEIAVWAVAAAKNPLSLISGLSWRVEREWVAS